MYKLGRDKWLGVRLEDEITIRGTQPNHVRQRHDAMEAANRMHRAGLTDERHVGRPHKRGYDNKALKALHKLQREWLTRRW